MFEYQIVNLKKSKLDPRDYEVAHDIKSENGELITVLQFEDVPFKSKKNADNFVSSFGFTYKNSEFGVEQTPFDWYYKGNGKGIVSDKQELILQCYGIRASVEVELCTVHKMNEKLEPIYLGYTLGFDFTDVGMRRENENMKNLSHLCNTAISNNLILAPIPVKTKMEVKLKRQEKLLWSENTDVEKEAMFYEIENLEQLLFRNKQLFEEGNTVYVLTGAVMSSEKANLSLSDGDEIIAKLTDFGISLKSTFRNEILLKK